MTGRGESGRPGEVSDLDGRSHVCVRHEGGGAEPGAKVRGSLDDAGALPVEPGSERDHRDPGRLERIGHRAVGFPLLIDVGRHRHQHRAPHAPLGGGELDDAAAGTEAELRDQVAHRTSVGKHLATTRH